MTASPPPPPSSSSAPASPASSSPASSVPSSALGAPPPVTVRRDGDVVVVTMAGARGNALSPAFIKELALGLYKAEQLCGDPDDPQACAIVLAGRRGVFCGGLDLKEGHAMDRGAVAAWVDQFEALFLQLFALRIPVVAALTGGAIAGGAVLALAADERIAARAPTFALGLTEVTLGLPLPSAALEIARFAVDPRHHVDVLLRGRRFDADECLRRGLVDVLVDVDHGAAAGEDVADPIVAAAVARARTFAAGGARAVGKTKLDLRHDALTRARARAIESRRVFVESWCDPQNAQRRTTLLASLTKKP